MLLYCLHETRGQNSVTETFDAQHQRESSAVSCFVVRTQKNPASTSANKCSPSADQLLINCQQADNWPRSQQKWLTLEYSQIKQAAQKRSKGHPWKGTSGKLGEQCRRKRRSQHWEGVEATYGNISLDWGQWHKQYIYMYIYNHINPMA